MGKLFDIRTRKTSDTGLRKLESRETRILKEALQEFDERLRKLEEQSRRQDKVLGRLIKRVAKLLKLTE